jgi:hypothetical protein
MKIKCNDNTCLFNLDGCVYDGEIAIKFEDETESALIECGYEKKIELPLGVNPSI